MNNTETKESDSRMFVDKVGLQFDSSLLGGERYRKYDTGMITIQKWGNTSQLQVHDELIRSMPSSGCAILTAMSILAWDGVFRPDFSRWIRLLIWATTLRFLSVKCAIDCLLQTFKIYDWELTLDLYGVKSLGAHDYSVFRPYKGSTYYTVKDYWKKRRSPNSSRPNEYKALQNSFMKTYRKDLQVGGETPITRLEWRLSGKYRKYIDPSFLWIPATSVYDRMESKIAEVTKKLGVDKGVVLDSSIAAMNESLPRPVFSTLGWIKN